MNKFPALHQAILDFETLDSLFSDIAAFGVDIAVIPKGRANTQVGEACMPLAEAHTALCSGAIQAVQLRYDHQGDRWCDTLMPTEGGWRLTRINLLEAASIVAE